MPEPTYILVTGATGFIGAHVVDTLLRQGYRVRGSARSQAKADAMLAARPQFKDRLDFVLVADFSGETNLDDAVKDVDAIIHVASPFTYDTTNNEAELVRPAINGVQSLLRSASTNPSIRRIVLTSSFAAVVDIDRNPDPSFTYTAADWNPLTYAESIAPTTTAVVAYRGSKKFAEQAAWEHVRAHHPPFDLVTLCPPMVFGPVAHPVAAPAALNESNAQLWGVLDRARPLPAARVPLWIDVRDLADAHVAALLRDAAGGKRYTPVAPERFSFGLAARIVRERFPARARSEGREPAPDEVGPGESYGLDGETARRELGVEYRAFETTVVDLVAQMEALEKAAA
ncbi:putative 3-beta hydroxysteroid dehydrogenase isomerase family protein [Neofusicoccum parvum UCRNP2]|uniref:Putative 3-beta hydroxysteroid dehydrogenase isomerase family protein n=1 Tax=Botryosphaeria parva (strain UCR-NP2) TaxID=1287680 RepID=R1EYR2_BOTPV|nr:putative 3-beta hydroxysteroid dehydrogenase isomerase family protein [Neofusicoccum parvum UCRNP2]